MRLVVSYGPATLELSAKSGKDMDRLADIAVAIINAMPETEPKAGFGFQAGSSLETEIAVED